MSVAAVPWLCAFPLIGRGLHLCMFLGRSWAGLWYALLTLAAASCEVYGGRSPCGTRLAYARTILCVSSWERPSFRSMRANQKPTVLRLPSWALATASLNHFSPDADEGN